MANTNTGINIEGPAWREFVYGITGPIERPVGVGQFYDVRNKAKNIQAYSRYYLAKTAQMFDYENLPDTINKHDLEMLVQSSFGIWLPYEGKLYCIEGSLGGEPSPNNMPTRAIGANAALNMNYNLKIDEECVVMPNDSSYIGLYPVIVKNCTLLVENELSIYIANVNSRSQTILSAGDDSTIESAREYLNKLEQGELGVIVNPKWAGQSDAGINIDMGGGAATTNSLLALIELEQYLKGSLEMSLGLRAPYNMKREALGDSEVSQADLSIIPMIDDMLYCREKAVEKINKLFSDYLPYGPITVKLSGAWAKIREEMNRQEEIEEELAEDADDDAEDDETIEEVTEGADKPQEAPEDEKTEEASEDTDTEENEAEERADDEKDD